MAADRKTAWSRALRAERFAGFVEKDLAHVSVQDSVSCGSENAPRKKARATSDTSARQSRRASRIISRRPEEMFSLSAA